MKRIEVESPAFGHGKPIPQWFSNYHESASPPLRWRGVPPGARELALIVDDPDAPLMDHPFVHWTLYKIEVALTELPEGIPTGETVERPIRALQGKTSFGNCGYKGPMPPPFHGIHHYHFKLYALDAPLAVEPGVDKPTLLSAMEGHVLGFGELIGTYEVP